MLKEPHFEYYDMPSKNNLSVSSYIEQRREEAGKRENEISQVINGREELLLLLFSTTVAVAWQYVCNSLRDTEDPEFQNPEWGFS